MILEDISLQLQAGKAKAVKELVQQAIAEGIPPQEILDDGLLKGMEVIGEKFKNNVVFIPDVMIAARAMNQGVALLKPILSQERTTPVGKVCIGTIRGDLHDIGKNLVKMMMESKGLEVVDLGTDVSPAAFVEAAQRETCQIIAISALLTTTMKGMEDVVKAVEKAGIRDQIKIMVGGAPVTQAFADRIGADVYTLNAATAAETAVRLCQA